MARREYSVRKKMLKFISSHFIAVVFSILIAQPSIAQDIFEYSDTVAIRHTRALNNHERLKEKLKTIMKRDEARAILLEMVANSKTMHDEAISLLRGCRTARMITDEPYAWCYGYVQLYMSSTGEMDLEIADLAVSFKNINFARRIYRHIIINYDGELYRVLVKKAEFALEDLK